MVDVVKQSASMAIRSHINAQSLLGHITEINITMKEIHIKIFTKTFHQGDSLSLQIFVFTETVQLEEAESKYMKEIP